MDLVSKIKMDRYCNRCEKKVVAHAFSEGDCTLCSDVISTSHTPCDKVCEKCSHKKNVCMSCGDTLDLPYGKITKDMIKEAVEYVFKESRPEPKERFIKIMSYCRGIDGPKNYGTSFEFNLCNDPECNSCRRFEKSYKEEEKEWKPEVWHGEKRGEKDYYMAIDPITPYPLAPSEMRALEIKEELTAKEITEKYKDLLNEEQINELKKYK